MPKLTEMQSKSAKPAETGSRLTDERGLFLYITPKGNKILRVRLRSLPSARATVEGNMQRKKKTATHEGRRINIRLKTPCASGSIRAA